MKKYVLLFCIQLFLFSCSTTENALNDISTAPLDWLIPINEVRDGGPGKDGIPSIDNPQFTNANSVTFLNDDDLVIGIFQDNVARAYPHIIMDWHEVTNDEINGAFFTLNYCPLTGTAFAWESKSNNSRTTFGVSGLLYNANLILYDRNTDSNWSQLLLECVNGQLSGDKPKLYSVIETNWKTWKTLYPNSQVLNTQTGFSRTYGTSPYGDYAVNNSRFIFRPSITNSALPNKQRVYAIIEDEKSKVYQFSGFENGNIIRDTFGGTNYLIAGNESIMNGFKLEGDLANLTFEYSFSSTEAFFSDNEGNQWSIFGNAISGPRQGTALTPAKSVMSYWFAIAAFYPNPEIYTTP
ncbi:DUF3179 domain-containing protein [Flavobacteriaceae bacterium MHTCC 0001]